MGVLPCAASLYIDIKPFRMMVGPDITLSKLMIFGLLAIITEINL